MPKPTTVNINRIVEHVGTMIRQLEKQSHNIKKYGAISADADARAIDDLVSSLKSTFDILKKEPEIEPINQSKKIPSQLLGTPLTHIIQRDSGLKNDHDSASKFTTAVQSAFIQALNNKILNPEPRTIISRLFESFKSFYNKYIAGVESSKAVIQDISNYTTKLNAELIQAPPTLDNDNPVTSRPTIKIPGASEEQAATSVPNERVGFSAQQSMFKLAVREIRDAQKMTENPNHTADTEHTDDDKVSPPKL